jgi:hypothetical protein
MTRGINLRSLSNIYCVSILSALCQGLSGVCLGLVWGCPGLVWDWSGVVPYWSGVGLGLVWIGLGLVWGGPGLVWGFVIWSALCPGLVRVWSRILSVCQQSVNILSAVCQYFVSSLSPSSSSSSGPASRSRFDRGKRPLPSSEGAFIWVKRNYCGQGHRIPAVWFDDLSYLNK